MGSWAVRSVLGVGVGGGFEPGPAVGVYETERDGFVRGSRFLLGGDRLFADRFAGHREPLFPFLRALWFSIGVQ